MRRVEFERKEEEEEEECHGDSFSNRTLNILQLFSSSLLIPPLLYIYFNEKEEESENFQLK